MVKVITVVLCLSVFLFSAEDTYVFEAKGEFAKELKSLVEKYSKEGKIDAKVYKKDNSIIGTIFNQSNIDINGKEIFIKKCSSCHGERGEIMASSQSRKLKDMTGDEIEYALYEYKNNDSYGGSMKTTMQIKALGLNSSKVNSIINYLHNKEKNLIKNENINIDNEEKSSYLK